MGCCQGTNYPLNSKPSATSHRSILLKKKQSAKNKRVRFSISSYNFKQPNIIEEDPRSWYAFILSQDSEWLLFRSLNNISVLYSKFLAKNIIRSKVDFQAIINHQEIICLVNDPKLRNSWDKNLKKFELLFGDTDLDATISCMEILDFRSRVYKRSVRKYRDSYYISYLSCDRSLKDDFIIFVIKGNKILEIFWSGDMDEELESKLERHYQWVKMLYDKILEDKLIEI